MKRNFELLLPAGDLASFKAALALKAPAVYLGFHKFSARKRAANFGLSQLMDIIHTAHLQGMKVYLTLNTIIYPSEMKKLLTFLYFMSKCPPDALIIQDLGLYKILREKFPQLVLHASTQMNNYSIHSLKFLEELGFSRAILARETTRTEMIAMKKAVKQLELEGFVHGALCVAFSGVCYFSSFHGGRSGNRGDCAQPCRLDYSLVRDGKTLGQAGWLSPRDLCLADEIAEHPLCFFKIEGRLKNSNYVYQVGEHYLKTLSDSTAGKNPLDFVFNRDFTKGHYNHRNPKGLIESKTPRGQEIGKTRAEGNNWIEAELTRAIEPGMGILFGQRGGIITKADHSGIFWKIWGGFKGDPQKKPETIFLNYVPSTADCEKIVLENFQSEFELKVFLKPHEKIRYWIEEEEFNSEIVLDAARTPMDMGQFKEKLEVFKAEKMKADVTITVEGQPFLSYTMLNRFKREIRERLFKKLKHDLVLATSGVFRTGKTVSQKTRQLWAKVYSEADFRKYQKHADKFAGLYFYYELAEIVNVSANHVPWLFPVGYEDRGKILSGLWNQGFNRILVADTGTWQLARQKGFQVMLDYFLPMANSSALVFAGDQGIKRLTVSPELPVRELEFLLSGEHPVECEQVVVFKPVLFFSACCFYNQLQAKGRISLEGLRGGNYPLKRERCLNFLIHEKYLSPKPDPCADIYRVDFSFSAENERQFDQAFSDFLLKMKIT
ncbi:MAG: U32 family peptidase [Candidatus Wallbacteria bacterium]|nr:U32 family peptidase [Candidatus Wallbacteria bacterium]